MKRRLFIFDLDGTLVDDSSCHSLYSWQDAGRFHTADDRLRYAELVRTLPPHKEILSALRLLADMDESILGLTARSMQMADSTIAWLSLYKVQDALADILYAEDKLLPDFNLFLSHENALAHKLHWIELLSNSWKRDPEEAPEQVIHFEDNQSVLLAVKKFFKEQLYRDDFYIPYLCSNGSFRRF